MMNSKLTLGVLLVAITVNTASLFAANPEDVFNQANTAFISGKYADAIQDYESLAAQNNYSVALFYNLGNAYYRNGQVGYAILNYERALWLDPRDADSKANLRFVRRTAGFFEKNQPWWQILPDSLCLDSWAWLLAVSFTLLCILFIFRMFRPSIQKSLRPFIWACLLVLSVSAVSVAVKMSKLHRAVILTPEVPLRIAPLEQSPSSATLPAGTILEVKKQHNQFFYVRSEEGKEGCVLTKQVQRIVSVK